MNNSGNLPKKISKLVITCGGTGGHFYPGLAIAVAAREKGCDVLILLSGINSQRQGELAEAAGIKTIILPQMPNPNTPVKFFQFVAGVIGGWWKSLKILKKMTPQAVLGMGSFAMTPVIVAAKTFFIPVFFHDGNTVIGKANRWLSFMAKAIGCAFPPVNPQKLHCHYEIVGMPVRAALRTSRGIKKDQAIAALNDIYKSNLSPDLPTILIMGGSLGAASFNEMFPCAFNEWNNVSFQVLHLSGKGKVDDAKQGYSESKFPLLLLDSSEHMELFMGAADFVFARAGGSTIAELTIFGKPAVLIPFPYAMEDHQRHNAEWFVQCGGGTIIHNRELTVQRILEELQRTQDFWSKCAHNSAAAAIPDATEKMLNLIEKYL